MDGGRAIKGNTLPATHRRREWRQPRGRLQYRLATALAATSGIAAVCAALTSPMPFWSGTIFMLALLSLLTCVVVIPYRTGGTQRR